MNEGNRPTWLVTGGAGFIGSNFIHQCLQQESVNIINLDALTYAGNLESLRDVESSDRYQFVHGNIGDAALVDQILSQHQPDVIVNFAAESHVDRSIDGPSAFIETNVVGTLNLLERSLSHYRKLEPPTRDAFRFLHVSTDEVYGSLGETGRFVESTPYAPNSPYSASKAGSDHLVRAWFHTYGFPVLTTNCSNNYGPYQFPEKLIPLMIQKSLAGQPLPIYGDGLNVRDWLHVEDHCSAIRAVIRGGQTGEVYNVGGDAEMTNIDVVRTICAQLDSKYPRGEGTYFDLVAYVTDRPGHDRRYAIDSSKLQGELGWRPEHTFTTGIDQTVQWYLDNTEWTQGVLDGSYRGERLGTDA